jgi:P-type Cu+ transporter
MSKLVENKMRCDHCGENCSGNQIRLEDHIFCCEGCKMVYQLINQSGLCDYYQFNRQPGINRRNRARKDKFAFLDDQVIAGQLVSFRQGPEIHVVFYLPQIHCSSCLYLLENLHRLERGILSSKVHFARKEVTIILNQDIVSLRRVADLLSEIGYEPYISLSDSHKAKPRIKKILIYQLGIAGFCFANIMLLSFPEYLGLDGTEKSLRSVFRALNFILSLPVFLFSAYPFYESAWKSLRHRFLNIDAPIALAIIVTFFRSAYEVLSGSGAGYFDSMSGIVFFMLAGRVLQDKTYQQLSFDRDYTSYFPLAVSILKGNQEVPTELAGIRAGDTLLIHHKELIPVDGILSRGKAFVDYSFVTGESIPVVKEVGEIIYAGGRQTGGSIELLSIREVSQSYLTSLWNRGDKEETENSKKGSFVHLISRYFTLIVLLIATVSAGYWYFHDHARIWNAVTAVLIIACPCALLLSSSFTNGNILRILGRHRFYLRNAQTIENLARIDHFVFDKTGTLTSGGKPEIVYVGTELTKRQKTVFAALAAQSSHPLSVALAAFLPQSRQMQVEQFRETEGMGIAGRINGDRIALGSKAFISGGIEEPDSATTIYISWNRKILGKFLFRNHYRHDIESLIHWLRPRYRLSVLSGDNPSEKRNLSSLFGKKTTLLFQQMPQDKVEYIHKMQEFGDHVAMIGDGLNDAIALRASQVGIAVTEDSNNFTPASDAILEADKLAMLPSFIRLCRANRKIIMASFMLSILYNLVGLYFAVQGNLSPMIAAILMPLSSLSILLITFGCSNLLARWLRL